MADAENANGELGPPGMQISAAAAALNLTAVRRSVNDPHSGRLVAVGTLTRLHSSPGRSANILFTRRVLNGRSLLADSDPGEQASRSPAMFPDVARSLAQHC